MSAYSENQSSGIASTRTAAQKCYRPLQLGLDSLPNVCSAEFQFSAADPLIQPSVPILKRLDLQAQQLLADLPRNRNRHCAAPWRSDESEGWASRTGVAPATESFTRYITNHRSRCRGNLRRSVAGRLLWNC